MSEQIDFKRNRWYWLTVVGLLLASLFLWACASKPPPPPTQPGQPRPYKVYGQWYQPLPHARDFTQQGKASWYGKKFHGRKTSNGEIYNMYAMTAAHKTLPHGTYVQVHNLQNNRSVKVRINDRGPFVKGRIIDLSFAAAKEIGMVGPGTVHVKIKALGAPAPQQAGGQKQQYLPLDYYSGKFTFQVGAFAERANAERLVQKLDRLYKNAHIAQYHDGHRTYYRVRVGRTTSLEEAIQYEQVLVQNGYPQTFIVAE